MNLGISARPLLFRLLVEELDKMWAATVGKTCGECFAGRSPSPHYNNGCCDRCKNLTPTGCKEKPMACAFWTCTNGYGYFKTSPPPFHASFELAKELAVIQDRLAYAYGLDVVHSYRTNGLRREYEVMPNYRQRLALMTAIRDIRALAVKHKRSELVQIN